MSFQQDKKLIYRFNPKWSAKTVSIKRAGGLTNRNYVVDSLGKKSFVRLPWETGVINRIVEGRNILELSRSKRLKDILPAYDIFIVNKRNILSKNKKQIFNLPDGAMMTEYIEGRTPTLKDFKSPEFQKKFARSLYTFHTSGVRFHNPYNPFRDEIQKDRRIVVARYSLGRFFEKQTIVQLELVEREAERALNAFPRGISAHNDILLHNLLLGNNGELYLLDFEYAGLNKKGGIFYDLGYVFRDSFFNPPRIHQKTFEHFLSVVDKIYKKKLDRSQIYWAVITALLVGIWWGVLRYYSVPRNEQSYFLRYVRRG